MKYLIASKIGTLLKRKNLLPLKYRVTEQNVLDFKLTPLRKHVCSNIQKKGKRKVHGVPQSQTAALPRPQEEEETDKSKQAQTKETYCLCLGSQCNFLQY